MSTTPSPDAQAMARICEQLITQIRCIADTLAAPVVRAEDQPPTPACNEPGPWGDAHSCIRPAGHTDDHEAHDGCGWRTGVCDSGQHRRHPGFTCPEVDQSRPYWNVRWEQEQQAPAADEDTQRTTRRNSLRHLAARASSSGLTHEDAALLREGIDTEIREHDTMRAVAAGNLRHVRTIVPGMQAQQAVIERARGMLRALKNQGATGKTYYVALTAALDGSPGPLCHATDPDTLRECALRIAHDGDHEDGDLAWPARAALASTEQPPPQRTPPDRLRAAYDESRQLIKLQKQFLISLRSIVMTAARHREDEGVHAARCGDCGRDHIAELRDAIHAADDTYAKAFPATADGPARPGRLPDDPTGVWTPDPPIGCLLLVQAQPAAADLFTRLKDLGESRRQSAEVVHPEPNPQVGESRTVDEQPGHAPTYGQQPSPEGQS